MAQLKQTELSFTAPSWRLFLPVSGQVNHLNEDKFSMMIPAWRAMAYVLQGSHFKLVSSSLRVSCGFIAPPPSSASKRLEYVCVFRLRRSVFISQISQLMVLKPGRVTRPFLLRSLSGPVLILWIRLFSYRSGW